METSLRSVNLLHTTATAMTSPLVLRNDSERYKMIRKHQRYYFGNTHRIASKWTATLMLWCYKGIIMQLHTLTVCRVRDAILTQV